MTGIVVAGIALVGVHAGAAQAAVSVKVKQNRVVVENPGAGVNTALVLKGRLAARSASCVRDRPVKLKSSIGKVGSDRTNAKGKFAIPFSLSNFIDGEPLTASVKAKGSGKRGPACKAGSSVFDSELVGSDATFEYDEGMMQFSGVVSSVEPGCVEDRPWALQKDAEQYGALSGPGGIWGPSPAVVSPSGQWRLGLGIKVLGEQVVKQPDGGLLWPYCHQVNRLKSVP